MPPSRQEHAPPPQQKYPKRRAAVQQSGASLGGFLSRGGHVIRNSRGKVGADFIKALSLHRDVEIDANSFPIAGPSACKTNKVGHIGSMCRRHTAGIIRPRDRFCKVTGLDLRRRLSILASPNASAHSLSKAKGFDPMPRSGPTLDVWAARFCVWGVPIGASPKARAFVRASPDFENTFGKIKFL
jgi:hypothetical protein